MAHFSNWRTLQLGAILQKNLSAKPSAGDGCQSPVSPQGSSHIAVALSHRAGAENGCRASPGSPLCQKRQLHCGICTRCCFTAVSKKPKDFSVEVEGK